MFIFIFEALKATRYGLIPEDLQSFSVMRTGEEAKWPIFEKAIWRVFFVTTLTTFPQCKCEFAGPIRGGPFTIWNFVGGCYPFLGNKSDPDKEMEQIVRNSFVPMPIFFIVLDIVLASSKIFLKEPLNSKINQRRYVS